MWVITNMMIENKRIIDTPQENSHDQDQTLTQYSSLKALEWLDSKIFQTSFSINFKSN